MVVQSVMIRRKQRRNFSGSLPWLWVRVWSMKPNGCRKSASIPPLITLPVSLPVWFPFFILNPTLQRDQHASNLPSCPSLHWSVADLRMRSTCVRRISILIVHQVCGICGHVRCGISFFCPFWSWIAGISLYWIWFDVGQISRLTDRSSLYLYAALTMQMDDRLAQSG